MKLPHALKERPPRCRFTLCQLVTSNESHQNSSLNGAEAPGSGFPSPPGGAHPLPPPALEQSIRDRGEHTRVRERNPGAGAQCAPVPRALEPPEGKGVSVPGARRGAETAKPGGQSRGAHGPPPAAPLPSPEHLMRDDGRFFNSETQQSRTFSKAGSSGRLCKNRVKTCTKKIHCVNILPKKGRFTLTPCTGSELSEKKISL
ncbi:uncharacterized protein LOC128851794 isoform X1 [Cuculus canorus]|uniref:uncharacterized protein LOC128851794 isoform X1 n=1 Tax=Cuculus canorus TaxID=55661 RepID=UPI0023AAC8EE|nr:uncharacterized protein LOC128851794 isoform X1 [Cuculus canorus]